MSLTQEQIAHIARLSRLSPSEQEISAYQKDLSGVVDYIDLLAKIPDEELKNIDLSHVTGLVPRRDEESSSVSSDALLACSPKRIVNHQIAIENIMG